MLSPSDFNNAVPQFTNGNYASNPINPQYVEEPTSTDYNHGVEPLQTLPAQWWNWFLNKFTARFNKVNVYVKNIFNELTQLLSLFGMTPDGTEGTPTTEQLKTAFCSCYPTFVKSCLTGTACGCVPTIGVAMGSTDGNLVATDANGNLKPTGITVGTAAGCDASCFALAGCTYACYKDITEPPLYNTACNVVLSSDTNTVGVVRGGHTNGLKFDIYDGILCADYFCGTFCGSIYGAEYATCLKERNNCAYMNIVSYCGQGSGGCNCIKLGGTVNIQGTTGFYTACIGVDCATSAGSASTATCSTCANRVCVYNNAVCYCRQNPSSTTTNYSAMLCNRCNFPVIVIGDSGRQINTSFRTVNGIYLECKGSKSICSYTGGTCWNMCLQAIRVY